MSEVDVLLLSEGSQLTSSPSPPPPSPSPLPSPPSSSKTLSLSPTLTSATGWQKAWPYVGMAMLGIVFAGLAWFLYSYAAGVGFAKLGTIEGTRPLLVIAAIMSTIAFGGALLFGSLFSSDGTFEERFRHAREIFLVFSGIFGTVIGFYFGAGEGKGPILSVSATLQETTLVAYAAGGTPPYKITVTYGPKNATKSEETKDGWARFVFDKEKDNITPLQLGATDSKNVQGSSSVALDQEVLKAAKWKLAQ